MLRKNWVERLSRSAIGRMLMLGLVGIFAIGVAQAASSVPAVVISSQGTIATGLTNNQAAAAVDACGNIYTVASYSGQVTEIPAGGGTPTKVFSENSDNWTINNISIDPTKSHLYVTGGQYTMFSIPIVNCSLQTANKVSVSIGNQGAISYWFTTSAIAGDASGNIFIATNNACCATANELIEEDATSTTGKTLIASLPKQIDSMTLDAHNNIFFVSGGQLYELPYASGAYAGSAVSFGGTYGNATGVSFDLAGNLYVTDNSASMIYEIPLESGVLNPADQFVVASHVAATSALTFGLPSDFYFTNNDANLYDLRVGYANLGSLAAGSAATATLGIQFNASEAPKSFSTTANSSFQFSGTSTCAAGTSYSPAQGGVASCTAAVTYTAAAPGTNISAFTVTDSTGAPLSEAYLEGVSTGAGLTADPGTVATAGVGYKAPAGVAVDALGNLYIADSGSNKIYEIAAGGSTAVAFGSGLNAPKGVAVDAAGNVFVADTGNNQIVEIPVVDGQLSSAAEMVVVASSASLSGKGLSAPEAVAVDGTGSLYIADTGNKRVVYLPNTGGWNESTALVVGSSMTSPSALAIDSMGDVFVADSSTGDVYKLQAPVTSGVQTTVLTGYKDPSGIAVDASGALFVVDQGNQQVLRVPNLSGTLTSTSAVNVAGQLNASGNPVIADPYGLALDSKGNVYVTDSMNAAAYAVTRTSSSQNAGTWSPNTTSGALSYLLENAGNAALTFGTPFAAASGDTSQFSLLSSESDACASGGTVALGASCTVEAEFAPTANGNYTYTLTLSSNAANATAQTVSFTGRGAQTAATTTTIAQSSPSGAPAYDQAVTFQVSVSSQLGTPDGSVSLVVDGITKQTLTLSKGAATFTLVGGALSGGTHSINAKYIGGDSGFITYSPSSSKVLAVTVSTVATTTTVSYTTLFTQPSSQPANTAMTLTATVASAFAGTPTGTVSFTLKDSGGNTTSGTGTLAASGSGGFQATYSYMPTSPAASVAYDIVSVTATYAGDENFTGSSSASSSFDVAAPQGSTVIAPGAASLTTSSAHPGSVTFTLTSFGGWTGVVGFSCDAASLPANTTCQFSPGQATVFANTAAATYPASKVQMSLVVNQPPLPPTASAMVWWIAGPMGFLLLIVRRRSKVFAKATGWNAVLLVAAIGAFSACLLGASGCGTGATFTTPKGTSAITVTAFADPFATGSTSTTVACSSISSYPCSEQTFKVNVTVQ